MYASAGVLVALLVVLVVLASENTHPAKLSLDFRTADRCNPTPSDWMIAAAAERAFTFSYRPVVSAARPPGFAPWRSEIDLGGCRTELQAGFVTSTTSAPLTALPNEAAARFVLALSANCPLCTSFSPFLFSTTNRNLSPLLRISIFPATVRLPFANVARVYAPFKSPAAARAWEGVLTSVGLFEISHEAHQSTRLAASWIRENDLASALPNTPKIIAGPLIVQGRLAAAPTEAVLAHA